MTEFGRLLTGVDFAKCELFGDEYIPEYAEIELERIHRERLYQNYLATAAEFITNNTAGGEDRKILTRSLADLYEPPKEEPQQETVAEIKKRQHEIFARLTGGERK